MDVSDYFCIELTAYSRKQQTYTLYLVHQVPTQRLFFADFGVSKKLFLCFSCLVEKLLNLLPQLLSN